MGKEVYKHIYKISQIWKLKKKNLLKEERRAGISQCNITWENIKALDTIK